MDYLSFAFTPLNPKAFAFKAGEEQEAFSFNAPVDWVLLELRDATDSTRVKARVTGVVQRDGDIVDAQTGGEMLSS